MHDPDLPNEAHEDDWLRLLMDVTVAAKSKGIQNEWTEAAVDCLTHGLQDGSCTFNKLRGRNTASMGEVYLGGNQGRSAGAPA